MIQNIALILSLVSIALLAIIFIRVIRRSEWPDERNSAAPATARWRKRVLWGLIVLFVPAIGYSLAHMPYGARAVGEEIVVKATGHQWRWELSQDTVPVGREIAFHVTADDVNHGFALYDSKLRLKAQTQAMPGMVNVLRYRFDTPGTYKVLCLEYCGMAHHNMTADIRVVAE
jgi:cytochrome c oxidase subunit 2